MKRFFAFTVLLVTVLSAEQLAVKGDAVPLTDSGVYYLAPQWSPDGSKLAFSGVKYTGIYILDFPGGDVTTLTRESGAGYGFSWSPDGEAIAARVSSYEKYFKKSQIMVYKLDGTKQALTDKLGQLTGVPAWTSSGKQVYMKAGTEFKAFPLDGELKAPGENIVYLNNLGIYSRNSDTGEEKLISPSDMRVLHLAISPNRDAFVYSTVSEKLWLANMDGSNVRELGPGTAPSWSPDGKWIVGMTTQDDGHVFTGAELVAYRSADGAFKQLTNTPDVFEMRPSWSPDGKHIAFGNEADGRIWFIEVEEK
ncbi:MAG: hypothetical protein K9M49_01100 [Candidatus Marinimicrobia bacterium]|nr:hypothetical protein [Candidatus Neomarinimicrobiota bacterium]MCF7850234.1 hypothetical protein [Candidatus Neomarinimicrobiota bacterium]MCF7903724.1 hypothetical protein [Candidatus Neomarinimicrobiota bacterium]